ncbi:MAG TPA: DEAD/DEAH box helicase [Verrucomicrobiae bacterium]|jgi:ERCC4-related helicase|nr:DEAD/DEAH box helicase [Verrucomicrobiae bacterium]
MRQSAKSNAKIQLPPTHNWRTTDADEVNKRRQRAREESFVIFNTTPEHPIFSNFRVKSTSGQTYTVEIRDLQSRHSTCNCVDFRTNGLGFCKHTEAVLLFLQARHKKFFKATDVSGSNRIEIVVDNTADTLRLTNGAGKLPGAIGKWFDADGLMLDVAPETALPALQKLRDDGFSQMRLSQEIESWQENRRRVAERRQLRHEYELKVQSGEWPAQETTVPLFPYQREGMLHLAFTERALLADEMGLGKTIQAIAACALLRRLGKANRVLVVTPASLKSEWEEQIRRFTVLDLQLVFGGKIRRLKAYDAGEAMPFFTIVNYEQMVADALDVNARLRPDVVVLDEAQRIKNWSTKTAQAVKRLRSRYAFVLTGTPIENRIDELHSLMDFLNPSVLGPLFRFNRDFYELDEKGRPIGCRNLDVLHQRIKPFMLRRRKSEVETELPERTDHNHFVKLSELQKQSYAVHEQQVLKLVNIATRRPLTKQEQEKLQRELAMMRMICDTNYILDPEDRTCPKLHELESLIEASCENDLKVIVFSEWERMLELVRVLCKRLKVGHAWHTGTVPQQRRRGEINMFKNDPDCRVFLSTDSGATGLNLQNASVVINCDLPWNPAKLEQRIARAWRKHQTRPVTVYNLISENTIEHRMLETLALKQSVAASVLDRPGEVKEIKLRSGRQAFVERLQQLVTPAHKSFGAKTAGTVSPASSSGKLSADPALAFAQMASERLSGMIHLCEENYPLSGTHTVLTVVVECGAAEQVEKLKSLHGELFGLGKTDPIAPVRLEVMDRTTYETIQRLIAAGLISKTTRASRPLLPSDNNAESAPLSLEETAKAKAHRDQMTRKLKMARLLGEGGFGEEARPILLEALHTLGRAFAVERRLPEPSEVKDTLQPPLSHALAEALPKLKSFLETPEANWKPFAECLSGLCLPA